MSLVDALRIELARAIPPWPSRSRHAPAGTAPGQYGYLHWGSVYGVSATDNAADGNGSGSHPQRDGQRERPRTTGEAWPWRGWIGNERALQPGRIEPGAPRRDGERVVAAFQEGSAGSWRHKLRQGRQVHGRAQLSRSARTSRPQVAHRPESLAQPRMALRQLRRCSREREELIIAPGRRSRAVPLPAAPASCNRRQCRPSPDISHILLASPCTCSNPPP